MLKLFKKHLPDNIITSEYYITINPVFLLSGASYDCYINDIMHELYLKYSHPTENFIYKDKMVNGINMTNFELYQFHKCRYKKYSWNLKIRGKRCEIEAFIKELNENVNLICKPKKLKLSIKLIIALD